MFWIYPIVVKSDNLALAPIFRTCETNSWHQHEFQLCKVVKIITIIIIIIIITTMVKIIIAIIITFIVIKSSSTTKVPLK